MSLRSLALIVAIVAGLAWWVVHESPETQVRNAHMELARALNKGAEDPDMLSILELQALRQMFADTCVISGDTRAQGGEFSPEEMTGNIIRMRGVFRAIDLTLGELAISFPVDDGALAEFSAMLIADSGTPDVGEVVEALHVTSRMRNIDGRWVFSEFHLSDAADGE